MQGIILKALSGFYYVDRGDGVPVACRARGKFRHQKLNLLVGDRVDYTLLADGAGVLDGILPRKNEFQRPAVANIDQLVVIASSSTGSSHSRRGGTANASSVSTNTIWTRRRRSTKPIRRRAFQRCG